MENRLWNHIQTVRQATPLVHNITNSVAMNLNANILLAAGASPIMAYAKSEIEDIIDLSESLVINIGTIDEYKSASILQAVEYAVSRKRVWVLDPVGAGASSYRDEILRKLISQTPSVIRGNASEIMALVKTKTSKTKGVDTTIKSTKVKDIAKQLAQQRQTIVCVSGETDIVTDGKKIICINFIVYIKA